jgi:cold shock CspA family protein
VDGRITALRPKGYGFIVSEDVSSVVFFHASALINREFDQLTIGSPVRFTLERNEKGLRGVDVAVV